MKLFTLPNIITLANLACGILGIWCVFNFRIEVAGWLIFIAAILDFLDGFVARIFKSYSEIGKQLDSLADMVSFGVLPSFILYYLLNATLPKDCAICLLPNPWILASIIPALFSALRLAKFNIDTRQSDGFIGLPTPANAIVVASFPLIITYNSAFPTVFNNPYFLVVYCFIISFFLISEIPMMAFKFKNWAWQNNKLRFIFIAFAVACGVFLKLVAVPVVILVYVVLSIVLLVLKPNER